LTDLASHLLALETELQTLGARRSEVRLRELLAADFREFGRSGGFFALPDVLSSLTAETSAVRTAIEDFSVCALSETVALATYRGIRAGGDGRDILTNRSSIWRLEEDGDWRMVFHQGTPAVQVGGHFSR
jgi:hypothetical protein